MKCLTLCQRCSICVNQDAVAIFVVSGGGGGLIHPKHGVQHVGSIIINKRAALPVYVCMGK